jgi:hypothetical protein
MRRVVLVLSLLTVPVWTAGITRAVLGVGLDLALGFGVVVALALGLWAWRGSRVAPFPAASWIAALLVGAGLGALAVWRLWDPLVGGMSSSAGIDGVQHLQFSHSFATHQPREYYGLVETYAFHQAVQRLFGLDPFAAMRALLYAAIVVACTIPGAVVLALRPGRWPRLVLVVLGSAGAAVVLEALLLPYLAYYQAHGFHSQIFGMVPLVAVALGYTFSPGPWRRLAWLAIGLVLFRYTYVLHAGDLAVAATVLGWRELRWSHPRLARVGLAAGLVVSGYLFYRLWGVAFLYGGITAADDRGLVLLGLGLAFGLGTAPWLAGKLGRPLGDEARRWIHFVALFTAVGTLVQLAWLVAGQPETYFFHKYALHRTVLGGLTFVVVAAELLVAGGAGRRFRWLPALLVVLGGGALALRRGAEAVDVYRPLYLERHLPAPRHFSRLVAEPALMEEIHDVLGTTGRRFGGLLSPYKLESLEAGAAFGGPGLAFWVDPALAPSGSCVFWVPPRTASSRGLTSFSPEHAAIVAELTAHDDVVCRRYPLALRPGHEGTLCHRCLAGTSVAIPIQPVPAVTRQHISSLMNLGLWQFVRPLGRGTMAFDLPAANDCRLSMWTQEDRPMAVAFDGVPLTSTDGHRFPIGDLAAGRHELALTSPPEVAGTPFRAQWGPQIRYLAIDCGEAVR